MQNGVKRGVKCRKRTEESLENTANTGFWKSKPIIPRELEQELGKVYKKIHRVGVFGENFYIWFLNNDDSISILLDVMENIYNSGKSIKELSAIIDEKYLARVKK